RRPREVELAVHEPIITEAPANLLETWSASCSYTPGMTVTVLVLDSVGLGALPDAETFGDAGSHTLDHTVTSAGVSLPNLAELGLGNITGVTSVAAAERPLASHGRMEERSPGKDTTT